MTYSGWRNRVQPCIVQHLYRGKVTRRQNIKNMHKRMIHVLIMIMKDGIIPFFSDSLFSYLLLLLLCKLEIENKRKLSEITLQENLLIITLTFFIALPVCHQIPPKNHGNILVHVLFSDTSIIFMEIFIWGNIHLIHCYFVVFVLLYMKYRIRQ